MENLNHSEIDIVRREKMIEINFKRAELQLNDEVFYTILKRITKDKYYSHLDLSELDLILEELIILEKIIQYNEYSQVAQRLSLEAMISEIGDLLVEYNLPWSYVHMIAKNKFGVSQLEWLTPRQCHSIFLSLKAYVNQKNT